jgi:hypothetical protein
MKCTPLQIPPRKTFRISECNVHDCASSVACFLDMSVRRRMLTCHLPRQTTMNASRVLTVSEWIYLLRLKAWMIERYSAIKTVSRLDTHIVCTCTAFGVKIS